MDIEIVAPRLAGAMSGNAVTARRWADILQRLGHRVAVREDPGGADLLVALHAHKSAAAIEGFHRLRPSAPIVLALAGTDLYGDLDHAAARRSLDLASRLILLQPEGLARLPASCRPRARVIHQSAVGPARPPAPRPGFPICAVGNLRPVKDPFRAADAVRRLPATSRAYVLHAGAALDDGMRRRAEAESAGNPRYRWLGELSHEAARELIASCRALVHTSRSEGGANVLSEALAAGVPVLASRIPGSVGVLGEEYPAFFPVGDTLALRDLIHRTETEPGFRASLIEAGRRRKSLVEPTREQASWAALLAELFAAGRTP